jgi:DNA processing protein
LYEKILDNGLVVSEYPAGTKPDRAHFPQRNRIIAGLSRAAIVMEAPKKSGALITAYLANDFCRDVYALPGSLDNDRAIGCLGLLDRGAQVILGEGELLEMLCAMPSVNLDEAEQLTLFSDSTDKNTTVALPTDLEPQLARVLEAIPSEPTSFDAIVQQAELDAASVSGALLQLELLELISQLPGMRYRRIA